MEGMKNKVSYLILPILFSAVLLTCRDDVAEPLRQAKGKVLITLRVPGNNLPSVQTKSGKEESEIQEVDIFAFKFKEDDYVFEYHTKGEEIDNTSKEGTYMAEFKASLTEGDNYNLLIVANASDDIAGILSSINIGTPLQEAIQKLEFENREQWNLNGEEIYKPIPMAGITGDIKIENGVKLPEITMIRMLSRIDVTISTEDFTLKRIHLCNYNTQGYITPNLNTEKEEFDNPSTKTHLPDNTGKQLGADAAFIYDVPETSNTDYRGMIYTFESAMASDDDENNRKNATCLLLEGEYNGGVYFYRVDFTADGSGENFMGDYMPLIRNHNYVINVTAAEGIGYGSPQDALASYTVPSNMRTRIISWSEGDIKEFVFNGQYFLGVSKSEFTLSDAAHDGSTEESKLLVTTNYPEGWVVEKILEGDQNPDWLKTQGSFSSANAKDELSLILTETQDTRTGHIYLKSGRLSMMLTVLQMVAYIPEFEFIKIEPDPDDGDLPGYSETTVTITAKTNDSWIIKNSLGQSKSMPASPLGEKELSLTIPVAENSWDDRQITVWAEHAGIKYGETTYLQKAIYYISDVTTDPVINTNIPGQGESYILTVSGNYPQVAVRAYDEANDVVFDTDMLVASSTSEQINFTIPNNGTGYVRTISFQYEKEPGVWANMLQAPQAKGNFLLKTGRVVALVDGKAGGITGFERPTWTEAMGIDSDYNLKHFYKENGTRDDNLNKVYRPTHDTGCGQYWEGDELDPKTGLRCWRLPHFDEIKEISDNCSKGTIDGLNVANLRYWYSTENPSMPNSAGIMRMRDGSFGINQGKTGGNLIRCVRDQ